MTTFERIKQTAKDRGLTLNQLNDKANLKNNIIYSWKTKTPSVENVKKVADVLGVSVDYLLGNTDEMHSMKISNSSEDADLKKYFDENIPLQFDGKEIPQEDLKIIKRILESMDDE